jgi:hypothetical protein
MSLTFGVAIPTYVKHAGFLQSLLENITSSTVKPDMISVSCSSMSMNRTVEVVVNSVPVIIQYTTEVLNPSQNRNKAASALDTDIISFLDGDDLMHPQRIEYVKQVFVDHPDIDVVYHSFESKSLLSRDAPFGPMSFPDLRINQLIVNPGALGILVHTTEQSYPYHIHHAHVTVRQRTFKVFKFDETPQYKYCEDSLYATTLISHDVQNGYLYNPLSRYIK